MWDNQISLHTEDITFKEQTYPAAVVVVVFTFCV